MFSQNSLDFLAENRLRNDKTWFNEHKEQYREVLVEPFINLVEALSPSLSEIDNKLLCIPKVDGSISRIWRDARFSKDKSLFRDSMWCMFVREKGRGLPEFFFVLSPGSFLYGCGYYSAGTASMEKIRELIKNGDRDFKAALSAYENQDVFKLDGDLYKKSRHPDAPENLRTWLDRKSICFLRNSNDFGLLFSDKLADELASGFKTLDPLYRFMIKAEEGIAHTPSRIL